MNAHMNVFTRSLRCRDSLDESPCVPPTVTDRRSQRLGPGQWVRNTPRHTSPFFQPGRYCDPGTQLVRWYWLVDPTLAFGHGIVSPRVGVVTVPSAQIASWRQDPASITEHMAASIEQTRQDIAMELPLSLSPLSLSPSPSPSPLPLPSFAAPLPTHRWSKRVGSEQAARPFSC